MLALWFRRGFRWQIYSHPCKPRSACPRPRSPSAAKAPCPRHSPSRSWPAPASPWPARRPPRSSTITPAASPPSRSTDAWHRSGSPLPCAHRLECAADVGPGGRRLCLRRRLDSPAHQRAASSPGGGKSPRHLHRPHRHGGQGRPLEQRRAGASRGRRRRLRCPDAFVAGLANSPSRHGGACRAAGASE